ncbi:MAG: cytidine deaminase [Anaerolineae bacterium]
MESFDPYDELVQRATEARERAYSPYSHYAVGAALLGKSGRIYMGCNVENASYGLTVCAERTAILKAVSEGEREFHAIAVVTMNGGTPCGACRQVLYEFLPPEAPVIVSDTAGHRIVYALDQLLAHGFGPAHLPGRES